jgi:NADH-quinone oxidoreductase subunit M
VTLGLFTGIWLNEQGYGAATQGIDGAIVVMLSHGVLTGGLFLCVGVVYNRLHSRLITDMGGLAKPMPLYSTLFMIMMLGSVGLPGLSGFIGEFLTMLGAFRANWVVGALVALVMILSAWYLFWMFQRVVFNKTNPKVRGFRDADRIEAGSLIVLSALTLLIGVWPVPLLEFISPLSQQLLTTVSAQIPNSTILAQLFK